MTPDDLDARNREAVAQHVLNFTWDESESSLKEHQFNEEYRSRRWFVTDTARRDYENGMRAVFCRSCMLVDERANVRAVRLYITIEEDPLRNAPCVCHLLCYNCCWEVYVNLPRDPRYHSPNRDMASAIEQLRHLPPAMIDATQLRQLMPFQLIRKK